MKSLVGVARSHGFVLAAAGLGAWMVLRAHSWEWTMNPQYGYGPLVPLLCLALFWLRWKDRPECGSPTRSGSVVATVLMISSAVGLALVQPVFEGNQDWRAVPMASAFAGVALLLCALYLVAGYPWLRHFAFPFAFFLIAVPWPTVLENRIMSALMGGNASLCVEALHWIGQPARQQGHLILLPSGLLGVEEACSGIRSLQTGLMVSLLAGEFFRLRLVARLALVALSFGTALLGNAVRTVFLAVVASSDGPAAVNRWHDMAGNSVLFFTVIVLWSVAWLVSRKLPAIPESTSPPPSLSALSRLRVPAAMFCVLWILSLGATTAWFAWQESRQELRHTIWTVPPAPDELGVRSQPFDPRTLEILLHPDVALFEEWSDAEGLRWYLFYFQWKPSRSAIGAAMAVHQPEVCLTAIGMTLRETFEPREIDIAGHRMLVKRYVFARGREPFHVFHVVESDTLADATSQFSAMDRLRNVIAGRRNRGLRVLEVAVRGAENMADAEARLAEMLETRLNSVPTS